MGAPPVQYHDYLQLEAILNAQKMKSVEAGRPAHDEMLFIIVHQTYELWFKQLNWELDAVIKTMDQNKVEERAMGLVVRRLERMSIILKLLIQQIDILETMTPLDFLDFRDLLFPSSGFQSLQFRTLENKLGLLPSARLAFNSQPYHKALKPEQFEHALKSQNSATLFSLVEKWLERTPFVKIAGFDFWQNYQSAVSKFFVREKSLIAENPLLSEQDKAKNLDIIGKSLATFSSLFDADVYAKAQAAGSWRFSYAAIQAALLIQVYRDQPIFQQPFRLLTLLLDLDEILTSWRYRHALMAKRMLGAKMGTGGSSGHDYLQAATEKHKVFTDLNQLTTFFISRSLLPEIPVEAARAMDFRLS